MPKVKRIPSSGRVARQSCYQIKMGRVQHKASEDKQQTVFCVSASTSDVVIKENPHKFAQVQEKGVDPFRSTRCPFCLSYMQLSKFLISRGKKGFDRGRGKCPECGEGMRLQTLVKMEQWIRENKPEEYAAWVYEYKKSGFWQKIKFAKWAAMLKSMGWNTAFFHKYKQLKGDIPTDEEKAADDAAGRLYDEVFGSG